LGIHRRHEPLDRAGQRPPAPPAFARQHRLQPSLDLVRGPRRLGLHVPALRFGRHRPSRTGNQRRLHRLQRRRQLRPDPGAGAGRALARHGRRGSGGTVRRRPRRRRQLRLLISLSPPPQPILRPCPTYAPPPSSAPTPWPVKAAAAPFPISSRRSPPRATTASRTPCTA